MNDKVTARVPAEIQQAFEAFLADAPEGIRTKQDGVRHILRAWLVDNGYLAAKAEEEETAP